MQNPKKELTVCTGQSCSRNFSRDIFHRAKKHKDVQIKTSCCMGICSMAPNIMLDGKIISRINPTEIDSLLGANDSAAGSKTIFTGPPLPDDNLLESVSDLLDI